MRRPGELQVEARSGGGEAGGVAISAQNDCTLSGRSEVGAVAITLRDAASAGLQC